MFGPVTPKIPCGILSKLFLVNQVEELSITHFYFSINFEKSEFQILQASIPAIKQIVRNPFVLGIHKALFEKSYL